jgi:hypothetical protein
MLTEYWLLFALSVTGLASAGVFAVLCTCLFVKKKVNKPYFIGFCVALSFLAILSTYMFIPTIQDYEMAISGEYLEETAVVICFTHANSDEADPEIHYSQPKFYIPEKDEYVILNAANVEIGKTYRIRYYPHTKICDAVPTE